MCVRACVVVKTEGLRVPTDLKEEREREREREREMTELLTDIN